MIYDKNQIQHITSFEPSVHSGVTFSNKNKHHELVTSEDKHEQVENKDLWKWICEKKEPISYEDIDLMISMTENKMEYEIVVDENEYMKCFDLTMKNSSIENETYKIQIHVYAKKFVFAHIHIYNSIYVQYPVNYDDELYSHQFLIQNFKSSLFKEFHLHKNEYTSNVYRSYYKDTCSICKKCDTVISMKHIINQSKCYSCHVEKNKNNMHLYSPSHIDIFPNMIFLKKICLTEFLFSDCSSHGSCFGDIHSYTTDDESNIKSYNELVNESEDDMLHDIGVMFKEDDVFDDTGSEISYYNEFLSSKKSIVTLLKKKRESFIKFDSFYKTKLLEHDKSLYPKDICHINEYGFDITCTIDNLIYFNKKPNKTTCWYINEQGDLEQYESEKKFDDIHISHKQKNKMIYYIVNSKTSQFTINHQFDQSILCSKGYHPIITEDQNTYCTFFNYYQYQDENDFYKIIITKQKKVIFDVYFLNEKQNETISIDTVAGCDEINDQQSKIITSKKEKIEVLVNEYKTSFDMIPDDEFVLEYTKSLIEYKTYNIFITYNHNRKIQYGIFDFVIRIKEIRFDDKNFYAQSIYYNKNKGIKGNIYLKENFIIRGFYKLKSMELNVCDSILSIKIKDKPSFILGKCDTQQFYGIEMNMNMQHKLQTYVIENGMSIDFFSKKMHKLVSYLHGFRHNYINHNKKKQMPILYKMESYDIHIPVFCKHDHGYIDNITTYPLVQYTFGFFDKIKKAVINVVNNDTNQLEKTKEYDYKKIVNQNINADKITPILDTKEKEENIHFIQIGYKAAKTPDRKPCIVKLGIYKDAKIIYSSKFNKCRANKVRVLDIIHVEEKDREFFTSENDNPQELVTSKDKHHELVTSKDKHRELVTSKDKPSVKPMKLKIALSFIHKENQSFTYNLYEDIVIENFDMDSKNDCGSGIHYHVDIQEVYKWFKHTPDDLYKAIDTDEIVVQDGKQYSVRKYIPILQLKSFEQTHNGEQHNNLYDGDEIQKNKLMHIITTYLSNKNKYDEQVLNDTYEKIKFLETYLDTLKIADIFQEIENVLPVESESQIIEYPIEKNEDEKIEKGEDEIVIENLDDYFFHTIEDEIILDDHADYFVSNYSINDDIGYENEKSTIQIIEKKNEPHFLKKRK